MLVISLPFLFLNQNDSRVKKKKWQYNVQSFLSMSIATFNSSPKTGCRKNITLLWKQMLLYIKFKNRCKKKMFVFWCYNHITAQVISEQSWGQVGNQENKVPCIILLFSSYIMQVTTNSHLVFNFFILFCESLENNFLQKGIIQR